VQALKLNRGGRASPIVLGHPIDRVRIAEGFPEESPVCSQGFGSPLQGEYFLGLGSEGVALGYDGFAFQAMSCVFHGRANARGVETGSAALQAADIPSRPYPGLAAWAKEEPALRA
jgi:hypothetical protein